MNEIEEFRDSWECPKCGCGYCVLRGEEPAEKRHRPHDLAFVLVGPCVCSPDHPDYVA